MVNRALKPLGLGGFIVYSSPVLIVVAVLTLFPLMACNVTETTTVAPQDSSQPLETSVTGQGKYHQVVIEAVTFIPLELSIKPGDTVTWVNENTNTHTVTSWYHFQDEDDVTHAYIGEVWDSGDIKPGQSFSRTFNQLGTFEYLSLPLRVRTPMLSYEEVTNAVGVVVVVN